MMGNFLVRTILCTGLLAAALPAVEGRVSAAPQKRSGRRRQPA